MVAIEPPFVTRICAAPERTGSAGSGGREVQQGSQGAAGGGGGGGDEAIMAKGHMHQSGKV